MKLNKISKSFFINLDRRSDRLKHAHENIPFYSERSVAVDGKSLELTEDIKIKFPDSYGERSKSSAACCLSHYNLWRQLVEDKGAENYLILEDDVVFKKGFTSFWNSHWSKLIPNDYSLIYLGGCQPCNKSKYHEVLNPYNKYFNNIKINNFFTPDDHYWHMSAQSYIISKQAASMMCQWVETQGFDSMNIKKKADYGVDLFILDFANENRLSAAPHKLFHLNPLMTYQIHEEGGNTALDDHSDLRRDKDKLQDNIKKKQQEFIKLKNHWYNLRDYSFLKSLVSQIPDRDIPKDKYSCYNPNQKIGIVSLYTSEIAQYAIESENSIKEYAIKQGYTFHVYRESIDTKNYPSWSKPRALLNHIDEHEVLIWMDSDTLIFNPDKNFEDILDRCVPMKKIIACEDIGSNNKDMPTGSLLNSGIVIFRSHTYTKNLIKRWLNFAGDKSSLFSSGGDQEVLCEILKNSDSFGFNRKIFPMNKFNTDPRFLDEDSFVVHFMGYGHTLKLIFMKYWNLK